MVWDYHDGPLFLANKTFFFAKKTFFLAMKTFFLAKKTFFLAKKAFFLANNIYNSIKSGYNNNNNNNNEVSGGRGLSEHLFSNYSVFVLAGTKKRIPKHKYCG